LLKDLGGTRDKLMTGLHKCALAAGDRSKSRRQFQALEKYGRTSRNWPRRGKIDPVNGRDNEIRRVMQVLLRRQK